MAQIFNGKTAAFPFIDGAECSPELNNLTDHKLLPKKGFPKRPPVNVNFEDITYSTWNLSIAECGKGKLIYKIYISIIIIFLNNCLKLSLIQPRLNETSLVTFLFY